MLKTLSALAVCVSATALAQQAAAATVVTSGSANIEFTLPLGDYSLGTNLPTNEAGNPGRTFNAVATQLDENNRPTGAGSKVVEGGAALSLRGSMYLYPLDTAGSEVASFATVKIFSFRPSAEDLAAGVTDEMRTINYVPTGTPGEYTDIRTGAVHVLTPAQEGRLRDSSLRTCCRHTLGSLTVDTAAGIVDGVIDNIAARDINFDGVIDASDDFHLFDLVATDTDGIFDLALTSTFAQFLNIGFTPSAFLDGSALASGWARFVNGAGLLDFAGGDVVGRVTYTYETAEVAPVPVPAALPLLAGGLGAMGLWGARRKRAA